jgi:hypothetical protein
VRMKSSLFSGFGALLLGVLACKPSPADSPDAQHTGPDANTGTSGDSAVAEAEAGARDSGSSPPRDAGQVAPCERPGTLCWDFESGNLPAGFTAYRSEFNGSLSVDTTRAHRGRYALHAADLSGGQEGQQGGPKHTVRFDLPTGFGPVLWGRAFVYTTPARPASHAGLFNARYPRPGSTATAIDTLDWYEVATYQKKYMTIWHPPEPPGYPEWVQVADKPLVLDAWACLEWLFDARNGEREQAADPRMWVDGVELTWPTSFVYPEGSPRPFQEKAESFTVLEVGAYLYQGLTTPTSWWIDDLAVGRERIGCD